MNSDVKGRLVVKPANAVTLANGDWYVPQVYEPPVQPKTGYLLMDDPTVYSINITGFDGLMVNSVDPPVGDHNLKVGESITLKATAGVGWVFDYWDVSDFEAMQYPIDWTLPSKDGFRKRKMVYDNPLTVIAQGVDVNQFNCTYRNWWYSPHFSQLGVGAIAMPAIEMDVLRPAKSTKEALFCPICHDSDHNNTNGREPICVNCNHALVPKSKLKDYNRKDRRRWEANLKKRGVRIAGKDVHFQGITVKQ